MSFGNPVGEDTAGVLLVNGVWQPYRDPDSGTGAGNIDAAPWWAEYLVAFDDDFADADQFHTFAVDRGTAGAGSFGNDYLAGGAANDMLFGQMGDDVVQGDGGIESAFAGTSHAGASRSPDGCSGTPGSSWSATTSATSTSSPSSDGVATDGEDYIEGNGGRDVIFGGLGQDDIVGGSSDFFSLTQPEFRPDTDDLIFGGSGNRSGRDDDSELGPADATSARR